MTEVATTYGQAMYDLARDEGKSQQILAELSVLDQSLSAEPEFIQLLSSPNIPKEERVQILDNSFQGKLDPYVLNFLKVLTEKGYMRHFSGCCQFYRQCYNKDNGIMPVIAYTAVPLSDELRRKLTAKLSTVTGKTIELDCRIDPETLGGVRLDFDGKQVDGTVRRRLEDIRGLLKNTVL
jgi:F-type H+-transporting ATPase subunit delta